MAYVEAGPADGEPVLLLHGEPSWSFLYRKVLPVLADAGLRAIAADLVGFGRSDKPADPGDHTYARHVEWMRALAFDPLDLHGVTLVGQDWGGLIGCAWSPSTRAGSPASWRPTPAADRRPSRCPMSGCGSVRSSARARAERVPAGAVRLPDDAGRRGAWPPTMRRSPMPAFHRRAAGDARPGSRPRPSTRPRRPTGPPGAWRPWAPRSWWRSATATRITGAMAPTEAGVSGAAGLDHPVI